MEWLCHQLIILRTTNSSAEDTKLDLMDPIFGQLLSTKSLCRVIEDWHLDYHTEEKAFTPSKRVELTDKKCKALHPRNQLHTTTDSNIMALLTTMQHKQQVAASVFQALGSKAIVPKDRGPTGNTPQGTSQGSRKHQKPTWFDEPPSNQGKWVCTHTGMTYQDGFVKKHNGETHTKGHCPSPAPVADSKQALQFNQTELAKLVAEQLSNQLQAHMAIIKDQLDTPQGCDDTSQHMDISDW